MKCTMGEAEFQQALKVITPPWLENRTDDQDIEWFAAMIRAEARDGRLTLRGPYGEISLGAEVDRPGVFFSKFQEFIEITEPDEFSDPNRRVFEASERGIFSNGHRFMFWTDHQAWFENPDDAPDRWEDVEFEEVADDEYGEYEECDEQEQAAVAQVKTDPVSRPAASDRADAGRDQPTLFG